MAHIFESIHSWRHSKSQARRMVDMDHSPVTVYQYEYFDRRSGSWQRGERHATPARIAKLGAVLLGCSGIVVHAHRVAIDGFVRLPLSRSDQPFGANLLVT